MSILKLALPSYDDGALSSVSGRLLLGLVSFVEATLFFCLITPAFFLVLAFLYSWATGIAHFGDLFWLVTFWAYGSAPFGAWIGAMPVWMWTVVILGYLLLITLYWTPGRENVNKAEVWGLVMFLTAAAVVVAIWQRELLGGIWQTFVSLFSG